MAKYICLVIMVVVHTVAAIPVPVALKKDAPKYSSDHLEETARTPRSTSAVTSGATSDIASIPTTIEGAEGLLPPGSMDNLTNQLKKLKEQVELYQMINDMLKAETQVQAMPYKVDQDEPQSTPQQTEVSSAPLAHHDDIHQNHHDDHHDDTHHDDQDYQHEDDQHHIDHHQQSHHQPQSHQYNKRQRQQTSYHH